MAFTTAVAGTRLRRYWVLMAGLSLLLSACSLFPGQVNPGGGSPSDPDPSSVSGPPVEPPSLSSEVLPEGTRELRIDVGETAQIYWGGSSASVGDVWGVLDITPDGVAEAGFVFDSEVMGYEGWENTSTGGNSPTALEITGISPGTATIRVQYCFQTELTEDCDQGREEGYPANVTVTVR